MGELRGDFIEKIYAGWLGKLIGIRLGAPVEGWDDRHIRDAFGEVRAYHGDMRRFAADDDSNGPIFLIRALAESRGGFALTARDVGEALLNYAPFEHGFFWWGGYGTSTEHTAYLNLRAGIPAPQSGSVAQNGATVAEQIGGQIFIDTWGLVAPGNPALAARYASEAASVTHGGDGVHGGVFVAACISQAFVETNVERILETGLSFLPEDCAYARVVRAVAAYHREHPGSWRDCFAFVKANYGYDKYPGVCHIIPNAAVMILALLYGGGDFDETLAICVTCGWDTDCNAGNVGAIMGVRGGLSAIDYGKWRAPINDVLICSGVLGALNIMDAADNATYLARLAASVAGCSLPAPWNELPDGACHFELPGSTHGLLARVPNGTAGALVIRNTDEAAYTGRRSACLTASFLASGRVLLYRKTYYQPEDFMDSRYDPSFSPTIYPGQRLRAAFLLPQDGAPCKVRGYVRNRATGALVTVDDGVELKRGEWTLVSIAIPPMDDALLDEAGFAVDALTPGCFANLRLLTDDWRVDGDANYAVDFASVQTERWNATHEEIAQFTRLKGLASLVDGGLHFSCADFGELYTGSPRWRDYAVSFAVAPQSGGWHMVNARVQGALRSYAAGFSAEGRLGLYKNENGYRALAETDYPWTLGKTYALTLTVIGNVLRAAVDGETLLECVENDHPYLTGAVGLSARDGSAALWTRYEVRPASGLARRA